MAVIRFLRGTTAQNNAYVGVNGSVTLDMENNTIRIHDGATPGGYAIPTTQEIINAIQSQAMVFENADLLSGNVNGQEVTQLIDGDYGWRDLFTQITLRGNGKNNPLWDVFRDGIYAYMFDSGKMMECWTSFHVDHDYAIGTPLFPHVHWSPLTAGAGTVRWGFEYTVAKGHAQGPESLFQPTTTVYIEQTVNNDQFMHMITETDVANAIPPDLIEPDSIIMARMFRDGVNDTYPGAVSVFAVDLHYQVARSSTRNKSPDFYV